MGVSRLLLVESEKFFLYPIELDEPIPMVPFSIGLTRLYLIVHEVRFIITWQPSWQPSCILFPHCGLPLVPTLWLATSTGPRSQLKTLQTIVCVCLFPHCGLPLVLGPGASYGDPSDYCLCVCVSVCLCVCLWLFSFRLMESDINRPIGLKIWRQLPVGLKTVVGKKNFRILVN